MSSTPPTGSWSQRRTELTIVGVLLLGVTLVAALVFPIGRHFMDRIDGIPVGNVLACETSGWKGGTVVAIQALWPGGHPPIDRICVHNGHPEEIRNNLAGIHVVVVHLADGSFRAHKLVGVGCGVDVPPEQDGCPTYSPPAR